MMDEKYYYDADAGEKPIKFIENYCVHVKGKWAQKPFLLEEWQKKFIREIFGWKVKETGVRKYRQVYLELPRKNGKSNLIACLGLYLLLVEREFGKEIYSCAGDREQAKIVFNIAKSMLQMNPKLSKLAKPFRDSIVVDKSNSFYKAISSDSSTKHGYSASAILFDEMHVQPNRDLYDTMVTSQGAREQPLLIMITTAGIYDPNSICWEVHDYAIKVRDKIIIDPTFLPIIYSADLEDDWTKEETWKKANPGYGTIISPDYIKRECEKAQQIVAMESTFRRLYLNQWVSSISRWISDEVYMQCNIHPIIPKEFKNRKCWAGLDLSSVRDLTALVFVFPDDDGERFDVIPYFFAPRETAYIRSRRDKVPYLDWAKDESTGMILTDGTITDYNVVKSKILECCELFDVRAIGYDRWNSTMLTTSLIDEGVNMVPWGQGYASLSAPTKLMESLVLSKSINHGGNPILRWMMDCIAMSTDPAGNIKPNKAKSNPNGRIDGIVSLIMGLGIFMASDTKDDGSNYDDRGIMFL